MARLTPSLAGGAASRRHGRSPRQPSRKCIALAGDSAESSRALARRGYPWAAHRVTRGGAGARVRPLAAYVPARSRGARRPRPARQRDAAGRRSRLHPRDRRRACGLRRRPRAASSGRTWSSRPAAGSSPRRPGLVLTSGHVVAEEDPEELFRADRGRARADREPPDRGRDRRRVAAARVRRVGRGADPELDLAALQVTAARPAVPADGRLGRRRGRAGRCRSSASRSAARWRWRAAATRCRAPPSPRVRSRPRARARRATGASCRPTRP